MPEAFGRVGRSRSVESEDFAISLSGCGCECSEEKGDCLVYSHCRYLTFCGSDYCDDERLSF